MTGYRPPPRCLWCGNRLYERWLYCDDACRDRSLAGLEDTRRTLKELNDEAQLFLGHEPAPPRPRIVDVRDKQGRL